ncbi:Calcium-dependent lipid-binding family protein [Perilla frutescens var. hirtella]|uniref:Calcium-dependent lipid-binding family protein n=1 Tax=Perilla frutescens var. hirtella TaxID=608512 RepID=A0AAD4NXS6_PERFH|nr:Calcium-dependent lipid-binding family protein [Perilla frutescens var. hirtella]
MKKTIGGRGRASYITGNTPAPSPTDSAYAWWEQEDQYVFTWIVQNIEPNLVNLVSKHSTSKAVWESLALTYGSGADSLQVFDLHRRANSMKQNGKTLEEIWSKLQEVWMSIDRKEPNPMECPKDIDTYNRIIQTQRVYQFLMALEERYEPIKKEILKKEPLPSVEVAYAMNRGQPPYKGKTRQTEEDKNKLVCEHCSLWRHTKESCFHLVGYLEWWDEARKMKQPLNQNRNHRGTVTVASAADRATTARTVATEQTEDTEKGAGEIDREAARVDLLQEGNKEGTLQLSLSTFVNVMDGAANTYTMDDIKNHHWIFDCGAIDTMTFDASDIVTMTKPLKTHVQTANGTLAPVQGAGTINLSPTLQLSNCLFVPTLSHKLLSISHVTKELNCTLLMQPNFCLLQDIRTGEIIGRDTERCGLYYVDKISQKVLSKQAQVPVALTLQPKVFGCSVFVHLPKHTRDKLTPCAVKCVFVSYGIHQKGYRCYDPKSRHMFTTMNCDFLESEYFFHHLSSQGERETSDSLSWLTAPVPHIEPISDPSSTDEVNSTAEISSDTVQSTYFGVHVPETSSPLLISEVRHPGDISNSDSSDSSLETTDSDREEDVSGEYITIDSERVEVSTGAGRYVLPPRSTRGVPPKRYSPDHTGKSSRYSVGNCVTSKAGVESGGEAESHFDPKMPLGTLEVLLVSANGLQNTDFIIGMDPYAILTCRTQEKKSSVASGEGSIPHWNETFLFTISAGVTELKIKIMDKDALTKHDFVGEATIPLEAVFVEETIPPISYDVVKDGNIKCGEIKLGLNFTHKRSRDESIILEDAWKESSYGDGVMEIK